MKPGKWSASPLRGQTVRPPFGQGGPRIVLSTASATRAFEPVRARGVLSRPAVSVVKMDIEGGEYLALEGAKDLISAKQPTFIIEWFEKNLRPYGISAETLLDFCAAVGYAIYAVPGLIPISGPAILRLPMTQTWTFALIPNTPAE